MNFAVPSLTMVNLDNLVDANGNHINYVVNPVINLSQVSSFFITADFGQKFTNIIGDNTIRFGIQFLMISGQKIDWYFNSENERNENYFSLTNSFKK